MTVEAPSGRDETGGASSNLALHLLPSRDFDTRPANPGLQGCVFGSPGPWIDSKSMRAPSLVRDSELQTR